jgi:hypothetical protein
MGSLAPPADFLHAIEEGGWGAHVPRLLAKKPSVELHFLEPRRFPALDKDHQKWKEVDRQAAKQPSRSKKAVPADACDSSEQTLL